MKRTVDMSEASYYCYCIVLERNTKYLPCLARHFLLSAQCSIAVLSHELSIVLRYIVANLAENSCLKPTYLWNYLMLSQLLYRVLFLL